MANNEQPIRQILDAYQAAVLAKDVDALLVLYDHEVCVFDMWGQWTYAGIDAWRGMVSGWFRSLGTERVVASTDETRILVSDDVAVAHAIITYQGVSAEGEKLRAMQNRLTWALARKNGTWKIVHEHTSAPVDFETMKAILKR